MKPETTPETLLFVRGAIHAFIYFDGMIDKNGWPYEPSRALLAEMRKHLGDKAVWDAKQMKACRAKCLAAKPSIGEQGALNQAVRMAARDCFNALTRKQVGILFEGMGGELNDEERKLLQGESDEPNVKVPPVQV